MSRRVVRLETNRILMMTHLTGRPQHNGPGIPNLMRFIEIHSQSRICSQSPARFHSSSRISLVTLMTKQTNSIILIIHYFNII